MESKRQSEGFGFVPSESVHHFVVTIPYGKTDYVYMSEHYEWEPSEERRRLDFALDVNHQLKVLLPRHKWAGIATAVQEEFNARLKDQGLRISKWKLGGDTPVSRLLGKELVLLAWAIEDADPALTEVAIRNWLGLSPEERWWLYTMTNAATGHAVNGRNRGWRKAVRYALTENPVSDSPRRKDDFVLRQPDASLEDLK